MIPEKFYNLLTQYLDIPFHIEDVERIEENCGTVWIRVTNGDTYYLTIGKCEDEDS